MDMNKAFYLRKEDRNPQWRVMDATGQSLGRLAARIANVLRGKDQAMYTPHTDSGDYVVVINFANIVLTGEKWTDKEYVSHSGYLGNRKVLSAKQLFAKDPSALLIKAVKLMLPKNNLSKQVIKKLKIYNGAEHGHIAQVGSTKVSA
ncbi:MAG: 50S ribosomal protein L13 [Candidatus Dependentiae bacterium]|nr:50S ribosomal protein L13 [Candidatus Dependentiae bacterium]